MHINFFFIQLGSNFKLLCKLKGEMNLIESNIKKLLLVQLRNCTVHSTIGHVCMFTEKRSTNQSKKV